MDKKMGIIRILHILQKHTDAEHRLISNQIVDKLFDDYGIEMGRKAVESNIHILQACGYAIEGSRKGWYMDERDFDDTVLQHLIESVLFSKYISNTYAKELVDKLSKLGSPSLQKNAKAVSRVGTTYHAPNANEYFLSLGEINDAIDKDRKISFLYGDYEIDGTVHFNNQVKVVVNPYKILVTNGFYYLLAIKEGETNARHYRLDKMSEVEILLSSYRKPITDTELKGLIAGEYLAEHSKMFSGNSIGVIIKIKKDKISHVIDTFGTKFTFVKETNNHYIIKVKSNENDVYYWALQFGEIAEIVEPQDLRDRIRTTVEELSMRYLQSEGDRYEEAINNAKYSGNLDLQGIDLSNVKDKHTKLKNIRNVFLSDNNLSDIAFLQNYKTRLRRIKIYNNQIKDISALKNLRIDSLELVNLPLYDMSPLKDIPNLEHLKIDSVEARDFSVLKECKNLRNLTIYFCNEEVIKTLNELTGLSRLEVEPDTFDKLNVEQIKLNNPDVRLVRSNMALVWKAYYATGGSRRYPYNLFNDAFGHDKIFTGNIEQADEEIEKIFDKLLEQEKRFATLWYKEGWTAEDISKLFNVSVLEIDRIYENVKKKLQHKSYNDALAKYMEAEEPNANYMIKAALFRRNERS